MRLELLELNDIISQSCGHAERRFGGTARNCNAAERDQMDIQEEMLNPAQPNSQPQPDSQLDLQLAAQVQTIWSHPPRSPERQMLLNRFVNAVLQSGQLGHPQRAAHPAQLYTDLYNEALQRTLMDICQKIEQYNPEHPVMAWVNFRLSCQFLEVVKDYQKQGITQMPKAENRYPMRLPTLDDLPLSMPAEEAENTNTLIRQLLQRDPEGRLQRLRLRERPEVTFQTLAIAKFVEGKSWAEVSEHLGVPAPTLCSFFNRQLRNLVPYFKQHLDL